MKDDYYDLEPTMIDKETEENAEEEGFAEEEKTKVIKKTTPAYAWLVGVSRKFNGKKFDVKQEVTSIGRGSTNDIVLGILPQKNMQR